MCNIIKINFVYSEIIDEAEDGAGGEDDGEMDNGLMVPLDSSDESDCEDED